METKFSKYLNKEVNKNDDNVLKHSKTFLYHVTNISNLKNIKKFGLIPEFGDTLKKAYGEYYNFNGNNDEDLVELNFDGILFFSEIPILKYSHFMKPIFNWEDTVLCIILKNNTIYHKIDDYPTFTDYEGNKVESINYISSYDMPIFIETGDWFSFEEQECEYVLYGKNLENYIKYNFPKIYKKHKDK